MSSQALTAGQLNKLAERISILERRLSRPSASVLDDLLTPAVLSERIGQTERTLSEWRINGKGPLFIRIGRSARYRPEAVDEWLLSREYRSTAGEVR
ncbi:helix-turn-helix domain-containing protein [Salinibacterium sp. SWN139]|uniref:helix-turn-helix transcriptional regulator n=1 Tax=Salinibacterium sp. SWN139 TaxID=2792055 RepID=UPI0018CD6FE6|nr:helix-turn-helix domain-containing protein [Salinibacterium sp. SWN139]MBH0053182.1 helix-turn-helix domain-containing protein [Salinibacterium sp. SWN139]